MPEIIQNLIDIFLHLDKNLAGVINLSGPLTYGLLFLIIFMETGFVITPFLPGDSLLFASGALAVTSSLNIYWLYLIFLSAAILGDSVNYWIGNLIGPKIFKQETKLIKKEYLVKTKKFYDKYGGQAIIFARFVPIVRTFAPFVAGVAIMKYREFIIYNILGGFAWVTLFLWSGYLFGNIPVIKSNFHYVVLAIIVISLLPMVIEWLRVQKNKESKQTFRD